MTIIETDIDTWNALLNLAGVQMQTPEGEIFHFEINGPVTLEFWIAERAHYCYKNTVNMALDMIKAGEHNKIPSQIAIWPYLQVALRHI